MKLAGKTILITGGTSGIGAELAKQLLLKGNTVIITGRDQDKLDATVRGLPGVHGVRCDITDPAAIRDLRDQVAVRFPGMNTLVNNAGIMRNLNMNTEHSLEDVTREIDTNLSGPVRMVQQFLPMLKAQREALIVNISSGLAFVPMPLSPVYCATKAGIHSFTQSLRVQMQGTNVVVVELAPPGVESSLFRGEFEEEMKSQKPMAPDIFVRRAIQGIEAGRLLICPGQSGLLYALSRLAPNFALSQIVRSTMKSVELQ